MYCFILTLASLALLVSPHGFSREFGEQRGFRGGRGGDPFGPPFLANVTWSGRASFFQLFQNQNQTKAQLNSAVQAWATTNNVSAEVTQFEAQMNSTLSERRANVTTAVSQLPEAIATLNSIEDAQNLTIAETFEQIRAAIEAMSPELRNLILAIAPAPPPRPFVPHGGFGGGFAGGAQGGFGGRFGEQLGGRGRFHGRF